MTEGTTPAAESAWHDLQRRLEAVRDPWIRPLLRAIVDARADRLRVWPAAVVVHHAYPGGLLEHILKVAEVGDAVARAYGVDPDLLLAGAVLHDIGKLEELQCGEGGVTYSREGNLLGHIVLGVRLLHEAAGGIEGFPSALLARLEHLVVSHHGQRELGSPVKPMTEEAFILSAVDDLDARLFQFRSHVQQATESEGEFTAYHPRLGRALFKPSVR